jgi:protease IV
MWQFLKFFLASLLAIVVFCGLFLLFLLGWIGTLTVREKPDTGHAAVLMLDLGQNLKEQSRDNPFDGALGASDQYDYPGLYDVIRMIRYAKTDSLVRGIYIRCNDNVNGLATSEELRNALLDFKKSHKFIYAYGEVISQRAYLVANCADKVYCHPKGGLEWKGFAIQYVFFKQALDKLEVEPEIFYAGKFKSATEPFRADHMTDANRLQSQVFLNDIYNRFLIQTAESRNLDTASLHQYANQLRIQTASDAMDLKLVDGLRYDDEVQDELRQLLKLEDQARINFVPLGKYARSSSFRDGSGPDKIALIYAQGDIVDGKGERSEIGGETYRNLVRKARMDQDVKAIVVRVNSGGGSAMASENIWRELSLARKEKPVILSFGDYAASGGYYISCGADSIFAQPDCLTGSIGVFSIFPNLQQFFKNKLGVTFDGVKTADNASLHSLYQPLTLLQRKYFQNGVDSIYQTFLQRVAAGRKISVGMVDSIAQGRVWTASRAINLGLVDKLGGLQDAIDCAARMAKVKAYRLREYPEPQSWWESLFGTLKNNSSQSAISAEIGPEGWSFYQSIKGFRNNIGTTQARMPFEIKFGF